MTHVARHPGDPEFAANRLRMAPSIQSTVSGFFEEELDGGRLSNLATTACGMAFAFALTDPSNPEAIRQLRIGARCHGAKWALVHSQGNAVELPVTTDTPQRFAGDIDGSLLSSSAWIDAFCWATIANDQVSLAAICRAPTDVWRTSRTKVDEYVHLLATALREYSLRSETAGKTLLESLRATDPKHTNPSNQEWVLDLDVPSIEVAARVFSLNAGAIDASLVKALELRKRYWSKPSRAQDDQGWMSLELTALVVLARRAGLRIDTTSDYVPLPYVDGALRDELLILCPYCVVPIPSGVTVCHACLEDPRHDAALEATISEFVAAARKPCPTCGDPTHHLAVRCASCRTRF